jgi:hypothetical protein
LSPESALGGKRGLGTMTEIPARPGYTNPPPTETFGRRPLPVLEAWVGGRRGQSVKCQERATDLTQDTNFLCRAGHCSRKCFFSWMRVDAASSGSRGGVAWVCARRSVPAPACLGGNGKGRRIEHGGDCRHIAQQFSPVRTSHCLHFDFRSGEQEPVGRLLFGPDARFDSPEIMEKTYPPFPLQ